MCFFQNISLVLVSRFINSTEFTLIALSKELYVIIYILKRIVEKRKVSVDVMFCALAIMVLLCYWIMNGTGTFKGQLSSFRQLYLPFAFYMFGRLCDIHTTDYTDIMRYYVKVCVIAVTVGIVDMIFGVVFWSQLGLSEYAALKNNLDYMRDGMYRSFYTYDFLGLKLRRMASILVDPVILGQLFGIGFLFAFFSDGLFKKKAHKYLCSLYIFIGLILTFAKGGIIIAVFSSCILLGKVAKKKIVSYGLLFLGICVFVIFTLDSIEAGHSGSNHVNGLISGIESLFSYQLGRGIGGGGNLADLYGGFENNSVPGDESYVGTVMAQMGWIGLIMNLLFWCKFFKNVRNTYVGKDINIINTACVVLFLTSFINFTAISFNSCFIYIILGAAGVTLLKEERIQLIASNVGKNIMRGNHELL